MATIDAKQSNSGVYQSDADAQASKRTSIGLSAHRPTAPSSVQRPPNAGLTLSAWWLVFLLIMLMLAISILLVARVIAPATTWDEVVGLLRGAPVATAARVHFQDDFKRDQGMLRTITIPGQAAVAVLPEEGVYRLDVWPGYLAWSRFTVTDADALTIDATATIAAETPDAAVGLIGRFVNEANYYRFAVDGEGRFSVMRYQSGEMQEVVRLTAATALKPAGGANRLTLRDDGRMLEFRANDATLTVIPADAAPVTSVGVGAQATVAESVTITFDEISVSTP